MPKTEAERISRLRDIARKVRCHIVDMVHSAQSGHCGGSLSAADIVTALYFDIMKIDPSEPRWENRDRFVLSKGHACPAWYAALAMRGYFPEEELRTLRRNGSRLQGHPSAASLPCIDATTGSLGLGFAQALGMALEGRMLRKGYTVWSILGDGELNEGIVWETANAAAKFGLDNLVAIVDRNNLQNDGTSDTVMPMDPIDSKFEAFNWRVLKIDGHDMAALVNILADAKARTGKPTVVIAGTIKGKGVSFMENRREWHGKPPSDAEYELAVREIEEGTA